MVTLAVVPPVVFRVMPPPRVMVFEPAASESRVRA
jgi:hypothetical protein